ncbi:MAG: hypothetical protein FJX68_08960 [Alphaproteobacteria bacterium]|nr:hypothetical protein [Alphaproteobacteria bacterium]
MSLPRVVALSLLAMVATLLILSERGLPRRAAPPTASLPTARPQAPPVAPRDAEETPELFPAGEGRDEAFYYCTACHGSQLVRAQGMTREQWDASLTWMNTRHGMAVPDAETRRLLLDYLTAAFPPGAAPRGWQNPFAGR